MNRSLKILILILLALNLSACGITAGGLRDDPGYASLDYPGWWEADKDFGFSIGRTPMRFAAWVIDDDEEPELTAMLRELKGMRIRVYEVDEGGAEHIFARIGESQRRLELEGWDRLVTIKEEEENVLVMVKADDEQIFGMAVLVADSEEAVFINMIGNIRPELFNDMMNHVGSDVDVPEIHLADEEENDSV